MALAHQKACPSRWPALPRRQEAQYPAESPAPQGLEELAAWQGGKETGLPIRERGPGVTHTAPGLRRECTPFPRVCGKSPHTAALARRPASVHRGQRPASQRGVTRRGGGGGVPSRGWGGGLSFLLSSGGHILGSWLHHPPPPPPSVLLTQRVRTSPRTLVITLPPSPAKDSKPFTTAAKSLLPWKGTYPQGPAIGRTTSLGHRIVSLRQGQMPHVPLWPSLRPSQPR